MQTQNKAKQSRIKSNKSLHGNLQNEGNTPPILAYSVKSFCHAVCISPRKFYALMQAGDGPKVAHIGRRTLIRIDAARQWLAKQEKENGRSKTKRRRAA